MSEGLADRCKCRLRAPIPLREAESPVVNLSTRPVPLVCPGKHKSASAAGRRSRTDLPVEHARLGFLAMAQTVQPDLTHDQRPVARKVLQAREVGLMTLLRLQVDVEANKVQERKLEILGSRIVHVGDKTVCILGFYGPVQSLQVLLHPATAEPAHKGGWDLVADRIAEESRVAGVGTDLGPYHPLYVWGTFFVNEETNILFCRQPHHDAEAVPLRSVEQRAGRHGVRNADSVQAVCRHLSKISLDNLQVVILIAMRIRAKGPIRHAPDPQLLVTKV